MVAFISLITDAIITIYLPHQTQPILLYLYFFRMEELGLSKDGGDVLFGQLYGMADHVSFSLGNNYSETKQRVIISKTPVYMTTEQNTPVQLVGLEYPLFGVKFIPAQIVDWE